MLLQILIHLKNTISGQRSNILRRQFLLRRNRVNHNPRTHAVVAGERHLHEVFHNVLRSRVRDPVRNRLQRLDEQVRLRGSQGVRAAPTVQVQEVRQHRLSDHVVVVGDSLAR